MIYEIANDFPTEILRVQKPPCISLYQPTHRHRPDNRQDPIRFKNLVQKIESSLKQKYPNQELGSLMKPFRDLAENKMFWEHTLDGLAVLRTEGECVIYHLQRPVKELAVVADSFHIKPLIRVFQSADRYHLLGLSRNEFTLYEGNRYGFEQIELDPEVPRTAREVLGERSTERYVTPGTYAGPSMPGVYHGHGGRKEEIDKDTEKFFRFVDEFVLDNYSRPTGLPVMLVALPEHHALFQRISRNSLLMKQGLHTAPDSLATAQLREAVWGKIEPLYLEKTKILIDKYEAAKAKGFASDDLSEIAQAALHNNVKHLLVEADRIVPGRVNPVTGELEDADLEHPEVDDLLDDLAEMVFGNKGDVVVLPKERMPTTTGAAAIRRY
ncbi:MAG TPA: hypothetical protein GX529_01875 [Firmicutes bacterium]|nr:hypothetical protein [Candidatus Fermentithermobacillaceae bacterium]